MVLMTPHTRPPPPPLLPPPGSAWSSYSSLLALTAPHRQSSSSTSAVSSTPQIESSISSSSPARLFASSSCFLFHYNGQGPRLQCGRGKTQYLVSNIRLRDITTRRRATRVWEHGGLLPATFPPSLSSSFTTPLPFFPLPSSLTLPSSVADVFRCCVGRSSLS